MQLTEAAQDWLRIHDSLIRAHVDPELLNDMAKDNALADERVIVCQNDYEAAYLSLVLDN